MVAVSSTLMAGTPSLAVSQEALLVDKETDEISAWLKETASVGYGTTYDELQSIAHDCAPPNWDGYGAAPVSPASVGAAKRFLDTLPLGMPGPSVGADSDGQITLEWYAGPRQMISVSVGPDGFLHFAALIGAATRYGREPFLGQTPQGILELIHKVAPQ